MLGCLLEKQRTTPDMYPLTLNGLRLACNQSTSRDPVVDYDDGALRDALRRLERRGFVRLASGQGSRAPKYRHLLAEALPMDHEEQAVMGMLMLRGTQTPGELKQRAGRMHTFASVDCVHETLERLIGRGLVTRLERRPGQKEDRYSQLLEELEADATDTAERSFTSSHRGGLDELRSSPSQAHLSPPASAPEWVSALHARIASLEREVADLRAGRQAATSQQPTTAEQSATPHADLYSVPP